MIFIYSFRTRRHGVYPFVAVSRQVQDTAAGRHAGPAEVAIADNRRMTHPLGKVQITSVPWGLAERISTEPPMMPARYFMV
jgi:hypothetical protein